jgi:RNA polymerase subunit RPABC4/transcription elongation factor Spt4
MNRKKPESEFKVCKRCNRHQTKDIICPSCKNELLSAYDNRIDWQTAFEIEQARRLAKKYRMKDKI